jgi:hypothetical protein
MGCEVNIKEELEKKGCEDSSVMELAQVHVQWQIVSLMVNFYILQLEC